MSETNEHNRDEELQWDPVADGIAANHARLRSDADAVPFFFTFLDYMRLALPFETGFTIARSGGDGGFSTKKGRLDSTRGLTAPFASLDGLCLYLDSNVDEESLTTAKNCLRRVRKIVNEHAGPGDRPLEKTLATGLEFLLNGALQTPAATPAPHEVINPHTGDEAAQVRQFVAAIHKNLAEVLSDTDLAFELVLKSHVDSTPTYSLLRFEKTDRQIQASDAKPELQGNPDCRSWLKAVEAAFETGFLQVTNEQEAEGKILAVPCHFGGVPWLVVCRRLKATNHAHWSGYTTYRDAIPRLNDSIRRVAWSSLFTEMYRLFLESYSGINKSQPQLIAAINQAWDSLTRVFPVPAPQLLPVSPETQQEASKLTFAGETWTVGFSEVLNRHFPEALPAEVGSSSQWGRVSQGELERRFLNPVQSEIRQREESAGRSLAENVYAIGHPLKHRLGRFSGSFETIRNDLKRACPAEKRPRIDGLVSDIRCRLKAVTNTAKCMDMMAELARRHGSAESMDRSKEFLVQGEYPLLKHLGRLLSEIQPRLEIAILNREQLQELSILPSIPTSPLKSRLFDPFYDDLFYELITNAEDKVPSSDRSFSIGVVSPASIELDGIDTPWCLQFVNQFEVDATLDAERHFRERLRLESETWKKWDVSEHGPKGGLRLLAVTLQSTNSGQLFVKLQPIGRLWSFSVAVTLPIGRAGSLHCKDSA